MVAHTDDIGAISTLVDLLAWRAEQQPEQRGYTFLLDGEREERHLTYAELDAQARAIGADLQRLGVIGERVLLLYPPGLDYIAAFFGCLYAGAVAVPAYPPRPHRPMPHLQAIVRDAQAKAALTTTSLLAGMERFFARHPELQALYWLPTDQIPLSPPMAWRPRATEPEALAVLQYTSGSTAMPKGVMLNHGNVMRNLGLIHRQFGHSPASRGVIWLPPYHDMGLIGGILQPLYGGFPVTLMPPLSVLQRPFRWLHAVTRYRGTTSGGPNFAYDLCVRKITPEQRAKLDLSSWDVAFNGAEPIRPETLEQFAQAFQSQGFRRQAFYPCYGLAEATLMVTGGCKSAPPTIAVAPDHSPSQTALLSADSAAPPMLVGCGRPLPDPDSVIIVDPDTRLACAPGQVGEIWVANDCVAPGYWRRPEATAQAFRGFLSDTQAGPYLRTGDLGCLRQGELFVMGRLKDVIIVGGRNFYPQDIELTTEQCHPALRPNSGAAFSIEMRGREQCVIVHEVERRYWRRNMLQDVKDAIHRAVADAHGLSVYAVALIQPGTLPKTSSGKAQRFACRAAYLSGALQQGREARDASLCKGETNGQTIADP